MRNLNMTVTCWMMALVAGLLIAVSQPANAVPVTTFEENFDALSASNLNGAHDVANAGDFIGVDDDSAYGSGTSLVNGWQEHPGPIHYHVVNENPNRNGRGGTNGLGSNYDGCPLPTGCGAAHTTNVVATTTGTTRVIARAWARLGFGASSNPMSTGEAKLYLGDSSLTTAAGGPFNAYEVVIDSGIGNIGRANGSLVTLLNGVASSTTYPDQAPAGPFFKVEVIVDQVGTPAETAILKIDDTTVDTFPSSGGTFDLTHIALVSINDAGGGGASLRIWDEILVQTELIPLIPEPATFSLLGIGAMGLMRRGRKA